MTFSSHIPDRHAHTAEETTMGNKQSSVELPEPPAQEAGGNADVPRSANGGALFKFENDAYNVLTSAVTPELSNDGDEEAPAWILDVSILLVVHAP